MLLYDVLVRCQTVTQCVVTKDHVPKSLGSKIEVMFWPIWACFSLFPCCLCCFLFPALRRFHLLSGRLRRSGHPAAQHDRDDAFYQRYISTDMMIVVFRCLESGKTVMMCMDVCALSRILEYYDVRLNTNEVDKFFTYNRVYFFSPSTRDYNFSVSDTCHKEQRVVGLPLYMDYKALNFCKCNTTQEYNCHFQGDSLFLTCHICSPKLYTHTIALYSGSLVPRLHLTIKVHKGGPLLVGMMFLQHSRRHRKSLWHSTASLTFCISFNDLQVVFDTHSI